jgi:hypothetical protein
VYEADGKTVLVLCIYAGGPKVSSLTYKSCTKLKMLQGIYSAIYGEVNVSVSGGYVLQYAGGTRASSCFISVTLKSWSGQKLLDPTISWKLLFKMEDIMTLNI